MKVWFIFILLLITLAMPVEAAADINADHDEITEAAFSTLSVDEVNHFIASMNRELEDDLPLLNFATVKEIMMKGVNFDLQGTLQFLLKKIFQEFLHHINLMGKLLFLAVLCAMLQNLQASFAKSGIAVLAYSVCFAFLSVIALHAFYQVLQIALQTISYMVTFMEALLPLMITLLAGVGALTSAALFSPIMLITISTVSVMVKNIVLPLLLIGAALECSNYLTDKYQLNYLTSLFKQSSMVMLGFMMMVFIGIITIQGVAGAMADGITLRAAKFATATFVPVVGKVFADTVELVMGASLMLKNAVGIFGVVVIVMICLLPLLKIFSLIAVMKLTGALIEPMGDAKMAKCLNSMGNNLLLVAGALLTVILMFFLAITMIIGAGSVALMLR